MDTPDSRVSPPNFLAAILARKRQEVSRRTRHRLRVDRIADPSRGEHAVAALGRAQSALPRVICEIKFRSPSAGEIRPWAAGEAVRVAQAYEKAGAAAVSVLADGPGFGGSPLTVRRVANAIGVPVLFKGFVLDDVQVELAFDVGASMVLLLVRALGAEELRALVDHIKSLGMEPVVEAADAEELALAIDTGAKIIGVNARDLRTFRVDVEAAKQLVAEIPRDRVGILMSGIRSAADLASVGPGRSDAVLVGEGLMREANPGDCLSRWLSGR